MEILKKITIEIEGKEIKTHRIAIKIDDSVLNIIAAEKNSNDIGISIIGSCPLLIRPLSTTSLNIICEK